MRLNGVNFGDWGLGIQKMGVLALKSGNGLRWFGWIAGFDSKRHLFLLINYLYPHVFP